MACEDSRHGLRDFAEVRRHFRPIAGSNMESRWQPVRLQVAYKSGAGPRTSRTSVIRMATPRCYRGEGRGYLAFLALVPRRLVLTYDLNPLTMLPGSGCVVSEAQCSRRGRTRGRERPIHEVSALPACQFPATAKSYSIPFLVVSVFIAGQLNQGQRRGPRTKRRR